MVAKISPEDAKSLYAQKGVVFLDVREPDEIAAGKVRGAVTIPVSLVPQQADQLKNAETVIIYCAAGGRAGVAAEALERMGFKDVRNAGGFKDWVAVGGAVE